MKTTNDKLNEVLNAANVKDCNELLEKIEDLILDLHEQGIVKDIHNINENTVVARVWCVILNHRVLNHTVWVAVRTAIREIYDAVRCTSAVNR